MLGGGIPGIAGLEGGLGRRGGGQGRGFGGIDEGRGLAHHLLYLGIGAGRVGIAVAVDARARLHRLGEVTHGG